jgi:hypothetical protein
MNNGKFTRGENWGLAVMFVLAVFVLLAGTGHVWGAETWEYQIPLPRTADTVFITYGEAFDSVATDTLTDTAFISFSRSVAVTHRNFGWARYFIDGNWWGHTFEMGNSWPAFGDSGWYQIREWFGATAVDTLIRHQYLNYVHTVDTFYAVTDYIDSVHIKDLDNLSLVFEKIYAGSVQRYGFDLVYPSQDSGGVINLLATGTADKCVVFLVYYHDGSPMRGASVEVKNLNIATDSTQGVIIGPVIKYAWTDANGIAQYPRPISVPKSYLYHDSSLARYQVTLRAYGVPAKVWTDIWIPDQDTLRIMVE